MILILLMVFHDRRGLDWAASAEALVHLGEAVRLKAQGASRRA